MPNSRFGYSVKKNSFKGLNIDCVQYSNIIRITYYSYSYSGTILNPNIIRIRIRPNICARILFVFVFAHSEKTNIIRIRIQSKFWFRIIFVFVFGPKNSIRSPLMIMNMIVMMRRSRRGMMLRFLSQKEVAWWSVSLGTHCHYLLSISITLKTIRKKLAQKLLIVSIISTSGLKLSLDLVLL